MMAAPDVFPTIAGRWLRSPSAWCMSGARLALYCGIARCSCCSGPDIASLQCLVLTVSVDYQVLTGAQQTGLARWFSLCKQLLTKHGRAAGWGTSASPGRGQQACQWIDSTTACRMMCWTARWPAACTASSPARRTCLLQSPRCAAPGARWGPCPRSAVLGPVSTDSRVWHDSNTLWSRWLCRQQRACDGGQMSAVQTPQPAALHVLQACTGCSSAPLCIFIFVQKGISSPSDT